MALRELLATFDIDTGAASQALGRIDGALDGAKSKLGALASAFVGSAIVGGLKSFVEGQIDAAKEVRLTAQKLGIGVEQLEEFRFAAETMGVSAEGAGVGLKFLNKNIGLALEGNQEAVQTFKKLDVAIKDSHGNVREIGDLLPEVADSFAKMGSQQERTSAAMKIFGRQGADLLPLLQGGAKGVDELRERFHLLGGGMSDDFIAKAKDAGRAVSGARFGFAAWKRNIAFEFFPIITSFGNKMQIVIGFLQKVTHETSLAKGAAITLGIGAAAGALKAAVGFASLLGVIKKGSGLLEGVISLGWFGLVIAAVALLVLGIQDLWTFMQGGDSVIGDLVTRFLGLDEASSFHASLLQGWEAIKQSFEGLGPPLKQVGLLLLDIAIKAAPYVVAAVEGVVRMVGSAIVAVSALAGALADLAAGKDLSEVGDHLFKASSAIFGKKGLLGEDAWKSNAQLQAENRGGPTRMAVGFEDGPVRGGVNVNQVNNVTNNISGVKDASAAGQAAKNGTKDALGGELKNAMGAVATGG